MVHLWFSACKDLIMMEGGLCAPSEHPLVVDLDIHLQCISQCKLIDTVMNNCRSGRLDTVRFLVNDAHCPVDATDINGRTALHLACQ